MALPSRPEGSDGWTWEDLQAIDDDGHRYEIVDGSLLVVSPPSRWHDVLAARLVRLLDPVLPAGAEAVGPGGLLVGRTVRLPDILVVAPGTDLHRRGPFLPDEVLLVVEVQSPSTVTTDRVTKPWEYARAGIASYWRLDPDDGPALAVHQLDGDVYRLVGSFSGDAEVALDRPFPIRFRPSDLLRR